MPPSAEGRLEARASASAVSGRGCSSRSTVGRLALPLGDLDRHDLVGEAAGVDRRDRPLLALERERILALARTPQRSATFSAVSPIEYG